MRGLLKWWPALPAALILYLGGDSFLAKFPSFSQHRSLRSSANAGPDSLLALARAAAADSAGSRPDSAGAIDPFRAVIERRAPSHHGQPPPPPPPRNLTLKGTVGSNVATITNALGQKLIVKVGDVIDSAEVLEIEANKVVLKDRAGKFELLLEK